MNPKEIGITSFSDIINKIKNNIPNYYKLTDDIKQEHSSSNSYELVTFSYKNGKITKHKVIGGAIGLSKSNKDRICIITKEDDPYSLLHAHIYNPDNSFMRYMFPRWDKQWLEAGFGDTFTWRSAKQRKITIDEISSLYVNKVFISILEDDQVSAYNDYFVDSSH